jgi:hypothetical protein
MIREMLSCLTGKDATEVLYISFHGFDLKPAHWPCPYWIFLRWGGSYCNFAWTTKIWTAAGSESATPLWDATDRTESGVAAALCHRSPKFAVAAQAALGSSAFIRG